MPLLSSLLGPTTPKLGTGMLQQGASALMSRPYKLHCDEAKAAGETPMTLEEFMAAQKSKV